MLTCQNIFQRGLAALLILQVLAPAAFARPSQQQLLETVQGFYAWTVQQGSQTAKLEPHIKDVPGTTRFYLDTSTLDAYTARFMQSGYFAPDFPAALSRYYKRYEAEFNNLGQDAFDQLAKDGRGPMMETEDMDPFFCAQEYEYQKSFVKGMKIKTANIGRLTATATVTSPYQWETRFRFTKVGNRWLISGYCVYE
jgi:hypothetical protein